MTRKAWLPVGLGVFAAFFLLVVPALVQEIITIPPPAETIAALEALFAHEPSQLEVQNAAMRYAEVHPDKIESWYQGAAWGSLLPDIRMDITSLSDIYEGVRTDIDHRYSYNYEERFDELYSNRYRDEEVIQERNADWYIQDTDYTEEEWITRFRTRTRESDQLTESLSGEWRSRPRTRFGVLFTWRLGEFLFNREQLYISREAQDLAKFRQKVLDELTVHWFDRRRAQIELMFSPPSRAQTRIDLQFRIARLTANIDAMTGGYLSKNIQPLYASR
jgi:hypothetical protein